MFNETVAKLDTDDWTETISSITTVRIRLNINKFHKKCLKFRPLERFKNNDCYSSFLQNKWQIEKIIWIKKMTWQVYVDKSSKPWCYFRKFTENTQLNNDNSVAVKKSIEKVIIQTIIKTEWTLIPGWRYIQLRSPERGRDVSLKFHC